MSAPAQSSEESQANVHWHTLDPSSVRQWLDAPKPLTEAEASRRLARYGPNALPAAKPRHPLARLLAQMRHVLIYVLLAAALVTGFLGHWVDTTVILAVVVVQTVVGFVQEGRAEQALAAIRHMLAPQTVVIREGRHYRISADQLVPGDTVLLEAGDRIPADMRLERGHNLRIDEALLTGESVAAEKTLDNQPESAAIGDQHNMAFSGTLVTSGTGRGIVVRTGSNTEIGRISELLAETTSLKTPLLEQMDRFARYLSLFIVLAGAAIFLLGWSMGGMPLPELFMAVVGLTVAAIPEGLPAILTITLAIGVRRMATRQAVVRHMPVIETLGAVSVICSDKTGTLTRNEMMVASFYAGGEQYTVSGDGYALEGEIEGPGGGPPGQDLLEELARACALCNDAHLSLQEGRVQVQGDPMESALQVFAHKAGLDLKEVMKAWPRVDEIPFDTEYRFMATLNHDHNGHGFVYLKGAPEQVLAMCGSMMGTDGQELPFDAERWHEATSGMARDGLRVLALARLPAISGSHSLNMENVQQGLQLLALVGLLDPPRQEAVDAIAECRHAGIRVKMITGDHALTASAIAARLGLENSGKAITGRELDAMDESALAEIVQEVDIFARTSPENKLQLIKAIQHRHGVVAMTGDGVNDAPALKRADVGIAMGIKGSEAAREAASLVLLDDNFASIAAAVREGRTVYANLKKAIAFLLPINGGEAVSLVVALLLGLTLPITALQILWVNLVSSVVLAMTLAFEPTEPDVMNQPPRSRGEGLLAGFVVWRVGLVSLLFLCGIFAAWYWAMARYDDVEVARTLSVNTLVAMEVFYLFAIRYLDSASVTLRGVLGTPVVLLAVFAVIGLQLMFTYLPLFQTTFGTAALDLSGLLFATAAGVIVLMVLELETAIRTRLKRTPHPA